MTSNQLTNNPRTSHFPPTPLTEWVWEDITINTLLETANRALGELNAFSLIVPDIDLLIEMHVVKEGCRLPAGLRARRPISTRR